MIISIRNLPWILFLFILVSCNKTLDLSNIEPDENIEKYNLDKYTFLQKKEENKYYVLDTINGIVKTTVKINNKSAILYFSNTDEVNIKNKINYTGIPIDSSLGVNILVYNNKVGYLSTAINEHYIFDFAEKLLQKYGKPTEILNSQQNFEKDKDVIYKKFHKLFPDETHWINDQGYIENTELSYPYLIIWDKGNNLYFLGLNAEYDGEIRNMYRFVSKEAYKDRVIIDLVVPTPKDSPLAKYLNK